MAQAQAAFARQGALAVLAGVHEERQAGHGGGAAIDAGPHGGQLQRAVHADVEQVAAKRGLRVDEILG